MNMKLTIANKLIISFALMAMLIVAAGGAGIYGAHQLKTMTQFIVGEAWDTADGAMEGTISLQAQVILTEDVITDANPKEKLATLESEIKSVRDEANSAIQRMFDANLIESDAINNLKHKLSEFYSAQEQLLLALKTTANSSQIEHLNHTYTEKTHDVINTITALEEIADNKVEGEIENIDSLITFVDSLIVGTLVVGLVLALVIGVISKTQISAPISKAAKRLEEIANGDGDLTVTLPVKGNDEIAELSNNFNIFLSKIKNTIKDVYHASEKITQTSSAMRDISAETNQSLTRQQAETEQVATSTNEMTSTVEEVARNAASAAEAATSANNEAMKGKEIVVASTHNIDSLAAQVKETTEIISKLEDDSNAIGSILDVIKDIAEQTNLLALNAAIEAARAGEMGRGFAVVADEVRNLAQRTQVSTQEIQEMIEKLQSRAQTAARAMEAGQNQAHSTVEQAHQAADSLSSIAAAVETINTMNMQIAAAAEEQSAVIEEINRNVSNITQQAETTTQTSNQTAQTGEELSVLADELNSHIRHFRV